VFISAASDAVESLSDKLQTGFVFVVFEQEEVAVAAKMAAEAFPWPTRYAY